VPAAAFPAGCGEDPPPDTRTKEPTTRGAAGAPTPIESAAGSARPSDQGTGAHDAQADDPDLDVNLAQPDFMLASLPTTLRLPRHKTTFRLTHRFHQALEDSGPDDLFGLDAGARVGIEFRFGVMSGAQVGFYRTGDRTIQLFTQYDIARQGRRLPFGVAAYASIEGTDNFSDEYSPGIGVVISHELGTRAAVYAEPFWVGNTDRTEPPVSDSTSTAMLALGVRLRVLRTTYVVAEVAPRMGGYGPGTMHVAFGIEKRAGGHLFQLNVGNNTGTTLANIARGTPDGGYWYLGFNLARKFY
jgi:hypothetical protein